MHAAAAFCRPLLFRRPCRQVTSCALQATGAAKSAEAPISRPPRFYVPARLAGVGAGAVLRLPPEESRHATKTLRLREGDCLELCDGQGYTVVAEIAGVDKAGAVVQTAEAPLQVLRTGWQWEVACACGSLKGGRSDWLVEKCTELGAAAFTPLLTERSPHIGSGGGDDDQPASSGSGGGRKRAGNRRGGTGMDEEGEVAAASGREGRWARVATAAMKQCLRPHAMAVSQPCSVQQLCERIGAADAALVGVAGAPPLHEVAARLATAQHDSSGSSSRTQGRSSGGGSTDQQLQPPPQGILCIGPEGDWAPVELEALIAAGAQPVGLGDLRLRAETAAVALLAYVRIQL